MIYSQIFHQILFFSRKKNSEKTYIYIYIYLFIYLFIYFNFFIFYIFNISENNIKSVELAQVLFSFFLKFVR